jgi:hypothetical protein
MINDLVGDFFFLLNNRLNHTATTFFTSDIKIHRTALYCTWNLPVLFFSTYFFIKIRCIIVPVVSYGCETCSLTLREEHRLRVIEGSVLRRILGSKRVEVIGDWRKLHNEELHSL